MTWYGSEMLLDSLDAKSPRPDPSTTATVGTPCALPRMNSAAASTFFLIRPAQCRRRARVADETGQHHNGEHVRHHLNELYGNIFARRQLHHALHLNRQRLGEPEEQARQHRLQRPPFAEDERRERDEAAARRHI